MPGAPHPILAMTDLRPLHLTNSFSCSDPGPRTAGSIIIFMSTSSSSSSWTWEQWTPPGRHVPSIGVGLGHGRRKMQATKSAHSCRATIDS